MKRPKEARVAGTPAERFARAMAIIIRAYDLDEAVLAEAFALARRMAR